MIQGLDPLGASSLRHEAIYLEGRGAIAQPEQARELGLPSTKVVNAAAASIAGQWATAAAPAATQPPIYTLGQAFAMAQAAAAAGAPGPFGGSEVMRLMQHAPAWPDLLRLIQGLTQGGVPATPAEAAAAGSAGNPAGWAAALGALLGPALGQAAWPLRADRLPRMSGLTGQALQQMMAGGGWATEALLMAGAAGVEQDLKVMLRRLLKGLQATAGTAAEALQGALRRGVDDLEHGQLETLSAQMQGQVLLQLVLPFGDGGPVALRVFRDRPREEEPDPEFVIDMHSRHSGLGPIWLRTAIQPAQRVALAMWAESADVARRARQGARELRLTLAQQGLRLVAFDIHDGPRPVAEDVFASADQRLAASQGPGT